MKRALMVTMLLAATLPLPTFANVITDWDEIAQKTIQPTVPIQRSSEPCLIAIWRWSIWRCSMP